MKIQQSSLSKFEDKSIGFDGCAVNQDKSVECTFNSTIPSTTLIAAFVATNTNEFCSEDNSVTEVTSTSYPDAVAGSSMIVVDLDLENHPTVKASKLMNTGNSSDVKFFLRADMYDNSFLDGPSILLKKVDFQATIKWTSEVEFSVDDLSTSVVETDTVTESDTHLVSIEAYRCNADGSDATTAGAVTVGSTLRICVDTTDEDVELTVKELALKDGTTPLSNPVGSSSGPNFLTTITEVTSIEGKTNVAVVSTLLTPAIFDKAGGETILASGTVSILYIDTRGRMLERETRDLQAGKIETLGFDVEFEIAKKELPSVAKKDSECQNEGEVAGAGILNLSALTFTLVAAVGVIVIG